MKHQQQKYVCKISQNFDITRYLELEMVFPSVCVNNNSKTSEIKYQWNLTFMVFGKIKSPFMSIYLGGLVLLGRILQTSTTIQSCSQTEDPMFDGVEECKVQV